MRDARERPAADAVLASESRILALATLLRSDEPLPLDGLVAIRALLRGRSGPLYTANGDLPECLRIVKLAIDLRGRRQP